MKQDYKKFENGLAFTLVEVILGMSMLSVAMMSITALTINSIHVNQVNTQQLTAHYLAQEAVEGFRNMRDSHWLQNRAYNESFKQGGFYTIQYAADSVSPWKLTFYVDQASVQEPSLLYLKNDRDGFFYTHEEPSEDEGATTPFHRYVQITYPQGEDANEDWFNVLATVAWEDRGRQHQVQLEAVLSDWREGPI
jgi:type II secretory pathway pseudopilin PulG